MGNKNAGGPTLTRALRWTTLTAATAAVLAGGVHRYEAQRSPKDEPIEIIMVDKGVCIQESGTTGSPKYGVRLAQVVDINGPRGQYRLEYGTPVTTVTRPTVERISRDHAILDMRREGPGNSIVHSITNAGIDSLVAEARVRHAHGEPNIDCLAQYKN